MESLDRKITCVYSQPHWPSVHSSLLFHNITSLPFTCFALFVEYLSVASPAPHNSSIPSFPPNLPYPFPLTKHQSFPISRSWATLPCHQCLSLSYISKHLSSSSSSSYPTTSSTSVAPNVLSSRPDTSTALVIPFSLAM